MLQPAYIKYCPLVITNRVIKQEQGVLTKCCWVMWRFRQTFRNRLKICQVSGPERWKFSHIQSSRCDHWLVSNCSNYCWLESFFGQTALPGIYMHHIHPFGFSSSSTVCCWGSTCLGVEEHHPNAWLLGRIPEFDRLLLPLTNQSVAWKPLPR